MVTKFNDFLNESIKIDLDNTTIGKSIFEYRGDNYRLTSYMYVYRTKDGHIYKYVFVNKEDANAVGGSGVGGGIFDLDKVTFLDKETNWSDEMIKREEEHVNRLINNDKERFEFIKSMPLNLTEEEYDKIAIRRAVDSTMEFMKNNKDYPYPKK